MLGGIGSTASLTAMLSRLDSDASGSISKDEFVAGTPDGVSEDFSAKLFDALDSAGSGDVSLPDLASAFQQMSSVVQMTLLQAQEQASGHPPAEAFAALDADGDGSLTEEEFIAGRPDDASEAQAEAEWARIAGDDTESLTETEFAENLKAAGPPPNASIDQLAQQLFAAIGSYSSTSTFVQGATTFVAA